MQTGNQKPSFSELDGVGKTIDAIITKDSEKKTLRHFSTQKSTSSLVLENFTLNDCTKKQLPSLISEKSTRMRSNYNMGLLEEINHVYVVVDNMLYLWNYDFSRTHHNRDNSNIVQIDSIDQLIGAVAIVKPKQDVFRQDVEYLLVVGTSVQVHIFALVFSVRGNYRSPLRAVDTNLSVVTDDVPVSCITGFNDRILYAGVDGVLHELLYRTETGIFSKWKTKTKCLSYRFLHNFIPKILFFKRNMPIVQMEIDHDRKILYTLHRNKDRSGLTIFSLASNRVLGHYTYAQLTALIRVSSVNLQSQTMMHIKTLNIKQAHLLVILNNGVKIYLKMGRGNGQLQLHRIRLSYNFNIENKETKEIYRFFNNNSVKKCFTSGDLNIMSGVYEHGQSKVVGFWSLSRGIESCDSINTQGIIYDIKQLPIPEMGDRRDQIVVDNDLLVQVYGENRKYVVLLSNGIYLVEKELPIHKLEKALNSPNERYDIISRYQDGYGRHELAVMLLQIITRSNTASVHHADRMLLELNTNPSGNIARRGTHRAVDLESIFPYSDKAFSKFNPSTLLLSLSVYFSRLVQPFWSNRFLEKISEMQPTSFLSLLSPRKRRANEVGQIGKGASKVPANTYRITWSHERINTYLQHIEELSHFIKRTRTNWDKRPAGVDESVWNHERIMGIGLCQLIKRTVEALKYLRTIREYLSNKNAAIVSDTPIKELIFSDFCNTQKGLDVCRGMLSSVSLRDMDDEYVRMLQTECSLFFTGSDFAQIRGLQLLEQATKLYSEIAPGLANSMVDHAQSNRNLDKMHKLFREAVIHLKRANITESLTASVISKLHRCEVYDGIPPLLANPITFHLIDDIIESLVTMMLSADPEHEMVCAQRCLALFRAIKETRNENLMRHVFDRLLLHAESVTMLYEYFAETETLERYLHDIAVGQDRLKPVGDTYRFDSNETVFRRQDLIAELFIHKGQQQDAFTVLVKYAMAEDHVDIADRVRYLSRAKQVASTVHVDSAKRQQADEMLDIALLQKQTYDRVKHSDSEFVEHLHVSILGYDDLFQCAYLNKLYDICLSIACNANSLADGVVYQIWENIFSEIFDSMSMTISISALVTSLSRYSVYCESCPFDLLMPELHKVLSDEHAVDILLQADFRADVVFVGMVRCAGSSDEPYIARLALSEAEYLLDNEAFISDIRYRDIISENRPRIRATRNRLERRR
ncbi:hypothetical protein PCE1_004215 [Barthelona sp. PCE]